MYAALSSSVVAFSGGNKVVQTFDAAATARVNAFLANSNSDSQSYLNGTSDSPAGLPRSERRIVRAISGRKQHNALGIPGNQCTESPFVPSSRPTRTACRRICSRTGQPSRNTWRRIWRRSRRICSRTGPRWRNTWPPTRPISRRIWRRTRWRSRVISQATPPPSKHSWRQIRRRWGAVYRGQSGEPDGVSGGRSDRRQCLHRRESDEPRRISDGEPGRQFGVCVRRGTGSSRPAWRIRPMLRHYNRAGRRGEPHGFWQSYLTTTPAAAKPVREPLTRRRCRTT